MLYDNCKLLDPEGQLLALVDAKRAQWYVKKGLGVVEEENPMTVRLIFQPSNSTNQNDLFYLTRRANQCVVCGTEQDLTRHHVIPQSFRKHFELALKSRSSHDVLAVCRQCHDDYNIHEVQFRKVLSERYMTSDSPIPNSKLERKYSSAARALLGNHSLPRKREDELLELLIDFLGRWPEEEDLRLLATAYTPYQREGCKTSSEYIVKKLTIDELEALAREWRSHFVETMKPKYLPLDWSIDRKFNSQRGSF